MRSCQCVDACTPGPVIVICPTNPPGHRWSVWKCMTGCGPDADAPPPVADGAEGCGCLAAGAGEASRLPGLAAGVPPPSWVPVPQPLPTQGATPAGGLPP